MSITSHLHSRDLITQLADRELPTFSMPAIAEFPYNYEDRLQRVLPQLARLHVFLPEPHDLALSKVMRWYANDESHVRELHRVHPMSVEILVERYRTEMDHVMGDLVGSTQTSSSASMHCLATSLRRMRAPRSTAEEATCDSIPHAMRA